MLQCSPLICCNYITTDCVCFLISFRLSEALLDFETTFKNLRGNLLIDYKQLGLQYKLYSCEVQYMSKRFGMRLMTLAV